MLSSSTFSHYTSSIKKHQLRKIGNMQNQLKDHNHTVQMQHSNSMKLNEKKVKDLMVNKKRLVEIPYTASLAQTMNTLVANKVVAVPVAAPPSQWIGAGGSMIVEADKQTGAVRKHYIGMVTMLDIVAHIAGDDHLSNSDYVIEDLDQRMSVPVSSIIGHSFEGLSLWTLNPNTSLLDCMEVLSKGVHRAMVPTDSQIENTNISAGVELVESSSSYQMLTQMDVLRFLKDHSNEIQSTLLSRTVQDLGAITERIYAITDRTKLIDAIKCLKAAMLNALPIVRASDVCEDDHKQHINGRCRKLVGTISVTDLRGCYIHTLKSWLGISALAFTEQIATSPLYTASDTPNDIGNSTRELVTCYADSTLSEVIDKAVAKHVHRVWVVDQEGLLIGVVSLSDVIRVIRQSMLTDSDA
ncbi:SNF1-related protein kinase regulatory subunit gamma-like PV42a isoform X2 [Vicia villosa]|uniref:SNF1-related protein kinase regulatory subunit gamma-like PV42a isoform X2 n=1 Tax=Vicia villosa TaxID=3911 RepID=UPI00273CC005|nr:SNF1-related protein kinase regulatory subunit gamma-like PV42a isoform X2 [Vicia villosa]